MSSEFILIYELLFIAVVYLKTASSRYIVPLFACIDCDWRRCARILDTWRRNQGHPEPSLCPRALPVEPRTFQGLGWRFSGLVDTTECFRSGSDCLWCVMLAVERCIAWHCIALFKGSGGDRGQSFVIRINNSRRKRTTATTRNSSSIQHKITLRKHLTFNTLERVNAVDNFAINFWTHFNFFESHILLLHVDCFSVCTSWYIYKLNRPITINKLGWR